MRTKALLMAAAALAAGLATSKAQVYSQNIVGYVSVPLQSGYSLVANQMDADGTGTNNTIASVMGTNIPVNTTVFAWNGSAYSQTKWLASGKWSANNSTITNAMQPGVGFFVNSPVATNITEVGNVLIGTNVESIAAGYQIVSATVPASGGIGTTFGYTPTKNDIVFVWNGTAYVQHKWLGSSWSGVGGEPQLTAGTSVFLDAAAPNSWTQVYTNN